MADSVAIRVEGLAEFRRKLREAGPEAQRNLRGKLRDIGRMVVEMATWEAYQHGLHDTGDLISGLKPGVKGTVGFVRDTATHRGYPYPKRIEWEDDGRHAFMRPAVEKGRDEIERRLMQAITEVIAELERGGVR